mmetsp:Transcript_6559/g.16303  ORF Transcript_6559/g.16303 Transcript_6559/m.16303 type:complete len:241 (-) Transcript_6559:20-742(-)
MGVGWRRLGSVVHGDIPNQSPSEESLVASFDCTRDSQPLCFAYSSTSHTLKWRLTTAPPQHESFCLVDLDGDVVAPARVRVVCYHYLAVRRNHLVLRRALPHPQDERRLPPVHVGLEPALVKFAQTRRRGLPGLVGQDGGPPRIRQHRHSNPGNDWRRHPQSSRRAHSSPSRLPRGGCCSCANSQRRADLSHQQKLEAKASPLSAPCALCTTFSRIPSSRGSGQGFGVSPGYETSWQRGA